MKQTFFKFVLASTCAFVISSVSSYAQGLDNYKQICIETRRAVKSENLIEIMSCRDRMKELKLREYPKEKFLTLKPEIEDTLAGHLLFHHKYLLELIKEGFAKKDSIPIDMHIGRRGKYDALITHRVVPANGEGLYKFYGKQDMKIVIISEDETLIEMKIECMGGNISYESKESSIPGCLEYSWMMGEEFSDVYLTIRNPSIRPVCCVIATN